MGDEAPLEPQRLLKQLPWSIEGWVLSLLFSGANSLRSNAGASGPKGVETHGGRLGLTFDLVVQADRRFPEDPGKLACQNEKNGTIAPRSFTSSLFKSILPAAPKSGPTAVPFVIVTLSGDNVKPRRICERWRTSMEFRRDFCIVAKGRRTGSWRIVNSWKIDDAVVTRSPGC